MSRSLVSVVLVLVLIGTLLFSEQVSTECISEISKVTTHSPSAYENVTTHEGDLIIDGTQTVVIENCTFIQTGNVQVRDSAKLTIKGSILKIVQRFQWEYEVAVEDYARLQIEECSVTSEFIHMFNLKGNSQTDISGSSIPLSIVVGFQQSTVTIHNCVLLEAGSNDECEMLISDSQFIWVTRLDFEYDGCIVNLNGLRPGKVEYWSLHGNETVVGVPSALVLSNTSVHGWSIRFSPQYSRAKVLNSVIERIELVFSDSLDILIDGVRPGFYDDLVMNNISLGNTSVSGYWGLLLYNSSGIIENSELWLTRMSGNADISIVDSQLDFDTNSYFGTVSFSNSSLRIREFGIYSSSFLVTGSLHLDEPSDDRFILWGLSNVTRNYYIIARSMSQKPVENVEVTLFDRNYTVVWNGTTDSLGEANFNVTFTDANYTDALCLKARSPGCYSAEFVSFLSSTPVTVTLAMLGDFDGNGKINIIDIVILAKAYCSRPGDTRWDPRLDLDDDGHIGIIDVVTVAKEHGKTR